MNEYHDIFVIVVGSVHLSSEEDLLVVVDAVRLLRLGLGTRQCRQKHRSQNRYDGNNHQQFN